MPRVPFAVDLLLKNLEKQSTSKLFFTVCSKAGKKAVNTHIDRASVITDMYTNVHEPQHEISNNVVCTTSKASDQPAHTHRLIRAFASCLNSLSVLCY